MLDLACNGYNNISMLDICGFIPYLFYLRSFISFGFCNRNPAARVFYVFNLISKYGNQSKIHIFL